MKTIALIVSLTLLVSAVRAQDPVKIDPKHYKVLFENDQVRVVEALLKPGEKTPMHSHPKYVLYSFNNSSAKFTSKDGKTKDAKVKAGQTMWREAETHAVENTGKTDIRVLHFELKK